MFDYPADLRPYFASRYPTPTLTAKKNNMPDKDRGLYEKFIVKRTDGRDEPGSKHSGCQYLVLDLTHDPHGRTAALAYAESCQAEYWLLAQDIRRQVDLCNRAALLEFEPDA